MADEIKLSVQLTYAKGSAAATFYPGSINISQAAQGGHFPIASVTTTASAISFGSVGTPGIVVGRNLDTTNSLLVGPTTTSTGTYYPFLKVLAGEPFAFRLNGSLWKWKSSAGTVKVQLQIYEN